MLSTFANTLKIPELRSRILFTIGLIAISRLLALIVTPGVDPTVLRGMIQPIDGAGGGLLAWMDMFSGGALSRFSIGTFSIWPYISASIIIQLMTAIVPQLERLAREGDTGRKQITQYTRWLTIAICLVQSTAFAWTILHTPESLLGAKPGQNLVTLSPFIFLILTPICMTGASMLVMWLGDQITSRGIGNGVSLIIMINICSRLPAAIAAAWRRYFGTGAGDVTAKPAELIVLLLIGFIVLMATVALTQGMRKVPLHSTRRMAAGGGSSYGSNNTYLPLRVNFSGVMPIIFAGPIISIPAALLQRLPSTGALGWLNRLGHALSPIGGGNSSLHIIIYSALILFFAFFWVATQFNAMNISDNLKREGSYVPGVRPGLDTAEYLDGVMTRVTLIGALGLVLIAVFPELLTTAMGIPQVITGFFGGTSLLIIVGVALDTLRQMESHLLMRNYDGFLKHGRIQGRR